MASLVGEKNFDDMLNRFDIIPDGDRLTDRQTLLIANTALIHSISRVKKFKSLLFGIRCRSIACNINSILFYTHSLLYV